MTELPDIIAFDPGKVTGWARLHGDDLTYGEMEQQRFCLWLESWVEQPIALYVVGEAFTITSETAKKSFAPWSLEILGTARFLCAKWGVKFTVNPVSAKRFASNDKLNALGWYHPSKGGHQNDAIRHLLVHLVSLGWWDERLNPE